MKSVVDLTRLFRHQGVKDPVGADRSGPPESCPVLSRWLFSFSLTNNWSQIKISRWKWKIITDYRWLSHPIQINVNATAAAVEEMKKKEAATDGRGHQPPGRVCPRTKGRPRSRDFCHKEKWNHYSTSYSFYSFPVFLLQLFSWFRAGWGHIDPMTRPQK